MKSIIIVLYTFALLSCVSTSEHEKVVNENARLKEQNEFLKGELEKCIEHKAFVEQVCTEESALETVKSHLNFYYSGCSFKDYKVRPSGECSYDISMKRKKYNQHWQSVVVRIIFTNDGKYNFSIVNGYLVDCE